MANEYTIDSEQRVAYNRLRLIQPCLLPIYTSFQMSLTSSQTPAEYIMVYDNEAAYFTDETTEPALKEILNKYQKLDHSINSRGILLEIQVEVAKIKVEKKVPLEWYDLKDWVSVNLIGQPLFGVSDNAIEWSDMIGRVYIPKSR